MIAVVVQVHQTLERVWCQLAATKHHQLEKALRCLAAAAANEGNVGVWDKLCYHSSSYVIQPQHLAVGVQFAIQTELDDASRGMLWQLLDLAGEDHVTMKQFKTLVAWWGQRQEQLSSVVDPASATSTQIDQQDSPICGEVSAAGLPLDLLGCSSDEADINISILPDNGSVHSAQPDYLIREKVTAMQVQKSCLDNTLIH